MHAAMLNRSRKHGGVTVDSIEVFRSELKLTENPFGLGYFDGPGGTLSHFIWGSTKGEHGPYIINYRAYRNPEQMFELLALIKSLGDQINLISTLDFGEIQLQDLLKQPFRHIRGSAKGDFEISSHSTAYWQMRILDLQACLKKTILKRPTVRFNLKLVDPIIHSLPEDANWRGIGGDYVMQLGEESFAETGHDNQLPTLNATINSFSRMWLGVRSASSLAITTDIQAEPDLLTALDETLSIPQPHLGWDF